MTDPAADQNQSVTAPAVALKESVIDPAAAQRASGLVVVLKEGGSNLKERGMLLERGHGVSPKRKDLETDPAVGQRETGRGLEGDPEVSPKGTLIIVPVVVPEAEGIVPKAIQTLSGKSLPVAVPNPLPYKKMEKKMPDPGPSHQWPPLLAERVLLLLLHAQPPLPVPDLVPALQSSLQCERV